MVCLTKTVKTESDIELLPLADLHIGDKHSNISHIKKLIEYISEHDNCYTVCDGDFMNCAIMGSKSDVYSENMRPGEQLKRVVDLFVPIKDKILCILPGNHEERISRSVGVDLTEVFAAELGLMDVYSTTSTILFLKVLSETSKRSVIYSIYINHGSGGGGRRAGSKVNALEDYAKITDCDCFICGHTHLPAIWKRRFLHTSPHHCSVMDREQLFINVASSLNWSGSYGDRMAYQPNSLSYPLIQFSSSKFEMKATL